MNRIIFLSTLVFTLCSCVHQSEPVVPIAPATMGNLKVADGFNYEMVQPTEMRVNFDLGDSSDESLQYGVIGSDSDERPYVLRIGRSDANGIQETIDVPLHISQLYLFTRFQGFNKMHPLEQDMTLSLSDLRFDDQSKEMGRINNAPACTSFLGSATWAKCTENGVKLHSSAPFQNLDIITTSGDTLSVPFNTGVKSSNGNKNVWTFLESVGEQDLSQVAYFIVHANCSNGGRRNVSLEFATLSNPCISEVDSDGDGVNDLEDADPSDENVSEMDFIPAEKSFSTIAFEDQWPEKGDYDFNDLVVMHHATVYSDSSGLVRKVNYQFSIQAVGASFNNDLCISFTDPNHKLQVSRVQSPSVAYQVVSLENATELRFKEIKQIFKADNPINTDITLPYHDPVSVNFTVLLDGSTLIGDFEIDEFIRVNQEEGREVHKPGEPYTSLANVGLFGVEDDDTRIREGKYYKSHDNLPWVLEIPIEWEYPKERVDLTWAYPKFKEYVQGNYHLPWYADVAGNKVHKHLYKKSN